MKKVLLTKTQTVSIRAGVVGDNNASGGAAVPIPIRVIPMPTKVITNTYMQRKSFQSIYEDIFKLLMRLPDKALQQRVIDAINGGGNGRLDKTAISKQCQCGSSPTKMDASTQTESLEPNQLQEKKEIISREAETPPPTANNTNTTMPKKRGRKRNTCVPQVVKRSTTEMALQEREDKQLTPVVTKKKKLNVMEPEKCITPTPISNERRNSTLSDISLDNINLTKLSEELDDFIVTDTNQNILRTMAKEYLKAHVYSEEGTLPIHDAILIGDIQGVKRQVYVWTKMNKMDFNLILTADDEDCLQLALTNDCDPQIVKIILNADLLPNHIYDNSNTALHLAVINDIQLESLKELMQRIDLNILLQINDDGYTALHMAVRHNRYKMAEIILDSIDSRQSNGSGPVYDRLAEESVGFGGKQETEEKKFAKYYEKACDRLELNKHKLKNRRLKREIINASETRAGNPPLFYAVEGEMEHLCYFLLAHLADPDEENLSGHSPKSFQYEYTRILRISLKISRIMDKVISILNC